MEFLISNQPTPIFLELHLICKTGQILNIKTSFRFPLLKRCADLYQSFKLIAPIVSCLTSQSKITQETLMKSYFLSTQFVFYRSRYFKLVKHLVFSLQARMAEKIMFYCDILIIVGETKSVIKTRHQAL